MLDLVRLETYLMEHIEGFSGPVLVKAITAGQSNPTFLLTASNKKYVLRKKPDGTLLKSAHAVDREFHVQRALWPTDVPVAPVVHFCEDRAVLGTEFYLMEFLEGRIFWDPALPEMTPVERRHVYDEMARVLAAIHSVDLSQTGLETFGKAGGYFARQLTRWRAQYQTSKTEELPEMDALTVWLEDNLPPDDGEITLVHGDYRIDNLMFEPDSLSVKAVFDWELSTLGHPLADLAYQIMQRAMGRDWHLRGLDGLDLDRLGVPSEQDYIARYCSYRGIDGVADWEFAKAFAYFRFAAICQGVKKRGLEGNAASPHAAKVGAMAAPLARLGYQLISGATRS